MTDRDPRRNSTALTLITIVIVAVLLYFLREVLVPLALATLLTFLLAPLVIWLQKFGLPRIPAVIVIVLVAFVVIGGVGWVLTMQVYDLAKKLPEYRHNIQAKLDSFKGHGGEWFERATKAFNEIGPSISANDPKGAEAQRQEQKPIPVEVHTPKPSSLEVGKRLLGPAIHPIGTAGLVVVFVIFMLLQREDLRDRLIRLAGTGRMHLTTQAFDEAGHRVSRYLLMQLVVNITYGFPIGLGLYFIGVPNPLLWGVLATLLRFIPYLGPTIAATLPIFLAFAVDPGWSMLIWSVALFVTIELISNNLIEPWLYSSSTGLSPVAIILAAVFWTWLWGPVGLFLSTPLTVCLVVLGRHVPRLGFMNVLLSDGPVLSLETRFYQRLLAEDSDEAIEIIEDFLKERPVVELYDAILIPALILSEADRQRGTFGDDKLEFLYRNMREIIEEFDQGDGDAGSGGNADAGNGHVQRSADAPAVVCVAARDEADELAALMLAKTACRRGIRAKTLTSTALSAESLDELAREDVSIVVVSSVPPAGMRQARHLCRRLRTRFSRVNLILGAWGVKEDMANIRKRFEACAPDGLVTTIKQAIEQLTAATAITDEMASAPVPQNDRKRLAELKRFELLDTPPDELFDRMTQDLVRTFNVPMALVTLVDEGRIFWKSQQGLPEDLATARESPRETSLCGHVVAANEIMVVNDLRADGRFANNPTVRERGLRFYAGAPLRTRNGHSIGTLCLMDIKPRSMSEGEKRYLQMTADKLMTEIEAGLATGVPA